MPAPSIRSIASRFRKTMGTKKEKKDSKPSTPAQQLVSQHRAKKDEVDQRREDDFRSEIRSLKSDVSKDDRLAEQEFAAPATAPIPSASTPKRSTPLTSAPQIPVVISSAPVKSSYLAIWNKEENSALYNNKDLAFNHYMPNAISIFETLDACHKVMASNSYLKRTSPGYIALAVNTYISILYYLRILQVRQTFGANTTLESQTLVRFERVRRLQTLPVPEVVRPHFEAIAAYKPDDPRLNWILPMMPQNIGGAGNVDIADTRLELTTGLNPVVTIHGAVTLATQPVPRILLDWMRYYCTQDINADFVQTAAGADPVANPEVRRPRYNYKGLYTPFPMGSAAAVPGQTSTLAGSTISTITDRDQDQAHWYMNTLGTDKVAGFNYEDMKSALPHWQASTFANIGPALTRVDEDLSGLQAFLGFDRNIEWISDLIDQVAVFSQYTGGAVSLNQLSIETGPASVIFTDVTLNTPAQPALIRTRNPRFHRTKILLASATQTIFQEEIQVTESYLARHLLTNSRFTMNRQVDNAAAGQSTYLTHANGARIGPYFNNHVEAGALVAVGPFSSVHLRAAETVVLDARAEFIRQNFYHPKPV